MQQEVIEKGWAVTIRFSKRHSREEKERMVKQLFREIMNEEHVQLAYTGTFVTFPTPHAHFIVFGCGKNGKGLRAIDKTKWRRRWEARSGLNIQALDIRDVTSKEGWKAYIFKKNAHNDVDSKQVYYNSKMLQKLGEME